MSDPAYNSRPSPLIERLHTLPYFRVLSTERLVLLARQATTREFAAGETIFHQGAPSTGLWIIEHGQVKVLRVHTDGREHIVHLAGPGESFNDIPALDQGPNAASAVALSDAVVWCIPGAALRAEIERTPDLALAVIDTLSQRTRELLNQIEDLALCSVTTRLARFLLKQASEPMVASPDITRATIAAHLATTPETLSRALRTLEDIGAIHANRSTITILQRDLLESVALG